MRISPFFLQLHTAYLAELDDLASDSEGKDVLRKRLQDKRQEIDFLLKMIELSPEMVAVIFHQGFQFPHPAVMDDLLGRDADEFPEWETLAEALRLTPWAQKLSDLVLREPMGPWFMTVAASLEYMHGRAGAAAAARGASGADDEDSDDADREDHDQDVEDEEERARDEAGADWMAEQGFDRKD